MGFLSNKIWVRIFLGHQDRGRQRGARGHEVARKDHVSRPQACSK